MAEDHVSRDQHRADLAELRLEIANSLATLDKRTELMAQELGAFHRDTERWHGELRQDLQDVRREMRDEMRAWRQSTSRQLWVMVGVVTAAVLTGVIKLVLLP